MEDGGEKPLGCLEVAYGRGVFGDGCVDRNGKVMRVGMREPPTRRVVRERDLCMGDILYEFRSTRRGKRNREKRGAIKRRKV